MKHASILAKISEAVRSCISAPHSLDVRPEVHAVPFLSFLPSPSPIDLARYMLCPSKPSLSSIGIHVIRISQPIKSIAVLVYPLLFRPGTSLARKRKRMAGRVPCSLSSPLYCRRSRHVSDSSCRLSPPAVVTGPTHHTWPVCVRP